MHALQAFYGFLILAEASAKVKPGSDGVPSCNTFCHNINMCGKLRCKNCQYTCSGKCAFRQLNWGRLCKSFCQPSDCGRTSKCKGCLFCQSGGINSNKSCKHPRFVDITEHVYSDASLFKKWLHSGYPYPHYGPPRFVDVNEDGMVDRNEFYWTFPELDLYEQFGKLDVNNDGFITIDELEN